jgi:hypothetical protein
MKVYCAWCDREGRPAFIGEKAPFDDASVTHGICAEHERRLLMGLPIPPTATLLVVVRRDYPELYRQLLRLAVVIPGLHVILDRRRGERRWLHRTPAVERRRGERRRPAESLPELGFTLVPLHPERRPAATGAAAACAWCVAETGAAPAVPHTEAYTICLVHRLREAMRTAPALHLARPAGARFLVIVRASEPAVFARLGAAFAADDRVRVLLDRRRGERRRRQEPHGPERRRGERRHVPDFWQNLEHHAAVLVPAVQPVAAGDAGAAPHRFEQFVQRVEGLGGGLRTLGRDAERFADTVARSAEVRQRLNADAERLRAEAAALAERTVRLRAQRESLTGDLRRLFHDIEAAAARLLERTPRPGG